MELPYRRLPNPSPSPTRFRHRCLLTGRSFQFVLFALSISCFICGYVVYSGTKKMASTVQTTGKFRDLYKEFQIVLHIFFAMGFIAFMWFMLEVIVLHPRIGIQRQQEIVEEIPIQIQSTSTEQEIMEDIQSQTQSRSTGQESSSTRRRHVTGAQRESYYTVPSTDDMETSPVIETGRRLRYMSLREYDNMRTVQSVRLQLEEEKEEV